MKIGLSLSGCVADIAEGKVNLCDVLVILAGTRIESEKDLEEVIKTYKKHDWAGRARAVKKDSPEFREAFVNLCESLTRKMWDMGIIYQGRVIFGNRYHHSISQIHCDENLGFKSWLDAEMGYLAF